MRTRKGLPALAGLAGVVLLATSLAACGNVPAKDPVGGSSQPPAGSSSTSKPPTKGQPASAPAADPVTLSANVPDGAKGVPVDTLVTVKATAGTLSKVKLAYKGKNKQGDPKTVKVPGTVSKDGSSWTADSRLDPAAKYELTMVGTNASDQATVTTKSSFTTTNLSLSEQTFPTIFPQKGSTVGVGMPVVLTFDIGVKNRKEFQKHLSVTASPTQEGSWHWYGNKEVHFRPKAYWKPGTKVSVKADLNGVSAGRGVYGQNSAKTEFTVGRSRVTKINLNTKMAKVYVDGKMVRRIPISGGKPGYTSRSGTKLIMAKLRTTRMASETIGIRKGSPDSFNLLVSYAMRVTASGEFLHAAPWNAAKFGRVNGSHGCIGMSTSNAAWLFNQVNLGDPVVTTGSGRGLEQGNGWTDWDISYKTYKKGSAI